MDMEFERILRAQGERYPLMQPRDYGLLAFQSEFGRTRGEPDVDESSEVLSKMWHAGKDTLLREPEFLGNGLARFPLTDAWDPDEAAPLVAALAARTAAETVGTAAGLERRLEQLRGLPTEGMDAWLADYKAQGCPPLWHSEAFLKAYRPCYRVLRADFACFFPAILAVARLLWAGRPAVVAIDGRCGSGKTTLAALLAGLFPCRVFHVDDYYLPLERRLPNWREIPAGNMDFGRFLQEVLIPAKAGAAVDYRPFDCQSGAYRAAERIPGGTLSIVEGSYSQHPALSDRYDLRIFLTCSREEQARRLQAREGAYFETFQSCWIPLEERYLRAFGIEEGSGLALDSSGFFPE